MTPSNIEIRAFQQGDALAFRELNEEWIAFYFGIEEHDRVQLGDPKGHILKTGGHIFMAIAEGERVGCCALIQAGPGIFELAKMAVARQYRGRGIGRQLLAFTISQAKALGAKSLYLGSNSKLANAVHLYESFGFRHLAPENIAPSPYTRANVFMELNLSLSELPETNPSTSLQPA